MEREHGGYHTIVYILSRKYAILLFCAVILFALSLCRSVSAAETSNKEEKSRAIAIVFDNSGTMYSDQSLAWSRAQYAMEVFASMANEGDIIEIYPMHDIQLNDVGEVYDSESNPLKITGGGDASVIRRITTEYEIETYDDGTRVHDGTPIESIDNAYNGLMKMSGDDKWLVVLTDGDMFHEGDNKLDETETETKLTQKLTEYNDSVNVLYLGIKNGNTVAAKPTVSGSMQHMVETTSDQDLLNTLTKMCNLIYGRDELPQDWSISKTMDLDLGMNKIILFVQGSDITGLELMDENGNEVGTASKTYDLIYPDAPGNNFHTDAVTDEELSGEIAVYENIPAGVYTMNYSGSSSEEHVYYEPNVSLKVRLLNKEGINVLEMYEDEIYPGEYTVMYELVDEEGNPTESNLLGEKEFTVDYTVTSENGKVDNPEPENSETNGSVTIEFNDGDEIDIDVDVTYLSGYYVSVKDDSNQDWPFPLTVSAQPDLSADIRADSYYVIGELDEINRNDPITVDVTLYGEKISSGYDKAHTKITLMFDGSDRSDWVEKGEDDEGDLVFMIKPQLEESDVGKYEITAMVTYDSKELYSDDTDSQMVQFGKISRWIRWAAIAIIAALCLMILLIILNQKALPRKIICAQDDSYFKVKGKQVPDNVKVQYTRKGRKIGTINISSPVTVNYPMATCSITLKIEAVDPRRVRSGSRRIKVKQITCFDPNVNNADIGSASFKSKNGRLIPIDDYDEKDQKNVLLDINLSSGWECVLSGAIRNTGGGIAKIKEELVAMLRYK